MNEATKETFKEGKDKCEPSDRQQQLSAFYGERNFIGNRKANIAGVGAGGALQAKRLSGYYRTTVVGP